MTSTSSSGARSATGQHTSPGEKPVKHVHHGRTLAAWAGSMIALLAFVVGGIGMMLGPNWVLFWIGAALLVISLIATVVLRKLGHGAD
jgi:hypothetical protein